MPLPTLSLQGRGCCLPASPPWVLTCCCGSLPCPRAFALAVPPSWNSWPGQPLLASSSGKPVCHPGPRPLLTPTALWFCAHWPSTIGRTPSSGWDLPRALSPHCQHMVSRRAHQNCSPRWGRRVVCGDRAGLRVLLLCLGRAFEPLLSSVLFQEGGFLEFRLFL